MPSFPNAFATRLAARQHQCKRISWIALCLIAGCVTQPAPDAPAVESPPAAVGDAGISGTRWAIEPGVSHVTIQVFRDGPLKALGHNHVITSEAINGEILIADDLAQSYAAVSLVLADLVVDDPAARRDAGPDFDTVPTQSDVEGTKVNMMGARVLNAAMHPSAEVRVKFVGVSDDQLQLAVTLAAAGGAATIPVTARFERTTARLTIEAAFDLDQRDLGIEPFSVLGGALRVAPKIRIRAYLVARPAGGS